MNKTVKIDIQYCGFNKKIANRFQNKINKGKYLQVEITPNLNQLYSLEVMIEYPNYLSAIKACGQFAKNKNILSINIHGFRYK